MNILKIGAGLALTYYGALLAINSIALFVKADAIAAEAVNTGRYG